MLYYESRYDIPLAIHSPGKILLAYTIREAGRQAVEVFDLGFGMEQYKDQ